MLYSRIVCIYIVNEQEYNRGYLGVKIVVDRDVDLDIGLRWSLFRREDDWTGKDDFMDGQMIE